MTNSNQEMFNNFQNAKSVQKCPKSIQKRYKKCRKGWIMQALYVPPAWACCFNSSIFVVQKATAPKNGVEFRKGSIGTIRSSLAMSYNVWRRRQFSTNQRLRNHLTLTKSKTHKLTNSHRINILSGPALRAAPAKSP